MAFELYKTFRNARIHRQVNADGTRNGILSCTLGRMNYESVIDSGVDDTPVDMTLTRVTTAELDGYECANNGWHYRVQTVAPAASTVQPNTQRPIGSVGFGGRQGEHWFWFRLRNVGYIHYPTRSVDDIGGAPDYSATPVISTQQRNLNNHPSLPDEMQTASTKFVWANIWTTPGGGELSIDWVLLAGKLKENIRINQAGREWVAANRPPSTPANETFFGFRFQCDASDIPRAYKNAIQQDLNGDFDDADGNIELANAADRLLAFMPLDYVYAQGRGGKRPLRKRFYRSGGQLYLFVGCRVDQLNQLLPGPLVFDPQMTQEAIAATADDGYESGGSFNYTGLFGDTIFIGQSGNEFDAGFRFTPPIPQGATITGGANYGTLRLYGTDYSATVRFDGPTVTTLTYGDDQDNAPAWQAGTGTQRPNGTGFTATTASAAMVVSSDPGSGNQFPDIDVSSIVEEIVGRAGWSSSNGMRFGVFENGGNNQYIGVGDYDDAVNEARLDVFYTTASNDIAAALTSTLTVAADLQATGTLNAAHTAAITLAADLSAEGRLDLAAALTLTVAADLEAIGELQAATTLALTVAADVNAIGNFAAAPAIALTQAADLSAQGRVEAAVTLALTLAASITGAANNDIAAAVDLALTQVADVDATGTLAAPLDVVLTIAAALDTTGTLTAALNVAATMTADVSATGTLTAAQLIALTLAADLNAPGPLAAATTASLTLAAELDAAGTVVSTPTLALTIAAALEDANAERIAAALQGAFMITATVGAIGSLSSAANIALTLAAQVEDANLLVANIAHVEVISGIIAVFQLNGLLQSNAADGLLAGTDIDGNADPI